MSAAAARYSILLDSIRTIQDTECPSPVGEARSRATGKRIRLPCNKWTCEYCGEMKVHKLRVRTQLGDLRPNSFLTLTLHRLDPVSIMAAWNRFITSMRDEDFGEIRYLLMKEHTRAGKLHLHILIEGWMPFTQLSRRWKAATGRSYWTNVKPVYDMLQAVRYVTKYMSKASDSRAFEKGERRYSASRGVLAPLLKSGEQWDTYIYPSRSGYIGPERNRIEDYSLWVNLTARPHIKKLGQPPPCDQQLLIEEDLLDVWNHC